MLAPLTGDIVRSTLEKPQSVSPVAGDNRVVSSGKIWTVGLKGCSRAFGDSEGFLARRRLCEDADFRKVSRKIP